jgi:hypothetical protein
VQKIYINHPVPTPRGKTVDPAFTFKVAFLTGLNGLDFNRELPTLADKRKAFALFDMLDVETTDPEYSVDLTLDQCEMLRNAVSKSYVVSIVGVIDEILDGKPARVQA